VAPAPEALAETDPGTNLGIPELDGVREAASEVTEVTEVNTEAEIEADEREVRS
jgi:hypothetical protein